MSKKLALTVREAADKTSVREWVITEAIRCGALRGFHPLNPEGEPMRTWRIRTSDLKEWMNSLTDEVAQ